MKRSAILGLLLIAGFIYTSSTLKVAAADRECGIYLNVAVNNILAEQNLVVNWVAGGSPTDVTLRREFWNGNVLANIPAEIYSHVESPGDKTFVTNADGYTEHYVLVAAYPDGTFQTSTCVVTVNSAKSPQPQVITFFVAGREGTVPGSTHPIVWETRNVTQVQLQGLNPNNQQVFLKSNLPTKGTTEFTIPADYNYPTMQLVLLLDQIPMSSLPPAAFLDLPINLSRVSAPTPAPRPTVRANGWQVVSGATYQEFEHGVMLYLPGAVRSPVVIMYQNGTWQFGTWKDVPTRFMGTPPTNKYIPWYIHAFGKVWAQSDDVRINLSWAITEEKGVNVEVRTGNPAWSIRMPDGSTRTLQDAGSSRTWTVTK